MAYLFLQRWIQKKIMELDDPCDDLPFALDTLIKFDKAAQYLGFTDVDNMSKYI